jgi:hypothetical protein
LLAGRIAIEKNARMRIENLQKKATNLIPKMRMKTSMLRKPFLIVKSGTLFVE